MSRRAPAPARRAAPRPAGARDSFELFAETLLTGVVVALLALPLVTALPAVAGGTEHLRRHRAGEVSGVRVLLRTARTALRGSWAVSAAVLAALALLGFNALVATGPLPGARVLLAATALLGAGVLVVALRAAGSWRPGASWPALVRAAARTSAADPGGSALVAASAAFVAVLAWMLPPLALPGAGVVVLGLVAVEARRPRTA
ncbi:hypothetical protein [Kineococcus indalonis]|uniref:hypothetical protein n=1 Tax=Kineococcus indalonis TaxID=2696566 RepID=UPI00196B85A8|nr:hypothetical protein [Kineococcus indalonis]